MMLSDYIGCMVHNNGYVHPVMKMNNIRQYYGFTENEYPNQIWPSPLMTAAIRGGNVNDHMSANWADLQANAVKMTTSRYNTVGELMLAMRNGYKKIGLRYFATINGGRQFSKESMDERLHLATKVGLIDRDIVRRYEMIRFMLWELDHLNVPTEIQDEMRQRIKRVVRRSNSVGVGLLLRRLAVAEDVGHFEKLPNHVVYDILCQV